MWMYKKRGSLSEPQGRRVGRRFRQSSGIENQISDDVVDAASAADVADVAITFELNSEDQRPYAEVKICGEFLNGLLDSGANVTVLGAGGYERVRKWKLPIKPIQSQVRTADGTMRAATGCVDVPYELDGKEIVVRTLLLEHITKDLILGTDFWKAFDIQPRSCDALDIEIPKVESEKARRGDQVVSVCRVRRRSESHDKDSTQNRHGRREAD